MFSASIVALAEAVLRQARAAGVHIATAESCTGGLIAGALTEVAGSSDVVDRGFIVYSNRAKTEMLGVPPALIAQHGAVSEEVARAMAEGALQKAGVELAVSCTGIAGPGGGTAEKPVGLVYLAALDKNGTALTSRCVFGDIGRDAVRMKSVEMALKLLAQLL